LRNWNSAAKTGALIASKAVFTTMTGALTGKVLDE